MKTYDDTYILNWDTSWMSKGDIPGGGHFTTPVDTVEDIEQFLRNITIEFNELNIEIYLTCYFTKINGEEDDHIGSLLDPFGLHEYAFMLVPNSLQDLINKVRQKPDIYSLWKFDMQNGLKHFEGEIGKSIPIPYVNPPKFKVGDIVMVNEKIIDRIDCYREEDQEPTLETIGVPAIITKLHGRYQDYDHFELDRDGTQDWARSDELTKLGEL